MVVMEVMKLAFEVGKLLFQTGLVDGASGNMSFREGESMYITRSGVNLYSLNENSFVKLGIFDDEYVEEASVDQLVHKMVYRKTDYSAVVHCHGVFNVVLSLKFDIVKPLDLEGSLYFGEIPVVSRPFGSVELTEAVADAVSRKGVAIAKGHGIYAAGNDLVEAFNRATYVEHSCEIVYRSLLMQERSNL